MTRTTTSTIAAAAIAAYGFAAFGGPAVARAADDAQAAPAPSAESAAPTQAADEDSAEIDGAVAFAERLTGDATAVLMAAEASEAQKLVNFQKVLADGLALDVIGKFMLGESRKTLTDAQNERYADVFPEYITRQYAEQFEGIVGRPLKVIDAKPVTRRDVVVRTQFERDEGSPINVDWRVRKLRSGERKAIDIIVSGVSIMLVKREEFSAYIEQNGVDALLDRLENEVTA